MSESATQPPVPVGCTGYAACVFLGMIVGTAVGTVLGAREVRGVSEAILREYGEIRCGEYGLIMVGYAFFGWLIGTAVGLGVACTLYLKAAFPPHGLHSDRTGHS